MTLRAKFEQGLALHQQGKLADAERVYRDVLRQQPDHFDALHMLGAIALDTRRTALGLELIRQAVNLNANVAAAHSNLGKALLDLNRPGEALVSFDNAIAVEPDFAMAHNNRGTALLALDRTEDAVASFNKALDLKNDFPEAWNNLGRARRALCCWNEAEAACRKAVGLNSGSSDAWACLGHCLNELERWNEAIAAFRTAIALKPAHINTWNHLGYALIALGRLDEAEEACRKAISFKPDDPDAWKNLSRALAGKKRSSAAIAAAQRAADLLPNQSRTTGLIKENLLALQEAVIRLAAEVRMNGSKFVVKADQIQSLHRITMQNLRNPGEYRKRSVVVGRSSLVPPHWADIPALMDDMCGYININWALRDSIHLGAYVLWRLAWIHPFGDGNGRTARAVCNAILYMKNLSPHPTKHSFIALSENQAIYAAYLACLKNADDTYLATQNFDRTTQHVEQWLASFVREYLNA